MGLFTEAPNIVKETARGLECIPIEDELLQSREIFLTNEVNPSTCNSLIRQLMHLNRESPEKEITMYINSPGGEVQSGLAVYDYMKLMPAPIRTVCIGTAASMGAILFLAGDKREMLPHSKLMIHEPYFGRGSLQGMGPTQIEDDLKFLKKTQKIINDIIAETTGQTLKTVQTKTRKDTFFDAEEAVKFGLATSIIHSIT